MAYTITKSNGSTLVTIQDGTVNNTATSLGLIGKNFIGWGQIVDTNFVKLAENFAADSPPPNPLQGQLWFHRSLGALKLCPYDGAPASAWTVLSTASGGGDATFGNVTATGNVTVGHNIVASGNVSFVNGTATNLATANITVTGTAAVLNGGITNLTTANITAGSTSTSGTLTGRWSLNSGSSTANALNVTGKILANSYCWPNGVSILAGIGGSGESDPVLVSHIANVGNPHSVTASQVGALPISGGTLTGTLVLNADASTGKQPLTYQQGAAFVRGTTLGTLPTASASDLTGSESVVQAIVNVEAKVDAIGGGYTAPTVIAVSTSRASLSSDDGNYINCTTSGINYTIAPSMPAGFSVAILLNGTTTISAGVGVTLNGTGSSINVVQSSTVRTVGIVWRAANTYEVIGA